MPRQQRSIQTSCEGRISLAIASYYNNKKQSLRALAKAYDVPESTLRTQSPTSVAIRQLAKSAQLAMQSAIILTEENKKLRAEVQRQRQKQSQQRQYIASGGVLQVQRAQQLAAEAERMVMEASQSQAGERRQRAPPTCTKCHTQGHTQTSCTAQ
ncbi:hypothetical protein GGP41_007672 [Bipolaris sorokiniana]|uniref:HTH psq-type domain-containing protein n=1 Tax=Cochliobolus sativus TaxID=45130 RepID=A0A8H5Z8D6_COCSA|nr:hypothetical protein GGP41_007672 [Bipolaris sorokiniana]